jgi:glycosyltransferase involved in cell wall biosynthesis
MRILQICKKVPWPLHDGESIAVYGLAKGLELEGHEIHLFAMNTSKHDKDVSEFQNELSHFNSTTFHNVNNNLSVLRLLKNLFFSSSPIHSERLKNTSFKKALISQIQLLDFDIVIMETVFASIYIDEIRLHSNAKLVIRCHNAEHIIWKRLANEIPYWKRWYFDIQVNRIVHFEKSQLNIADLYLTMSKADKTALQKTDVSTPCEILPIGLEISTYNEKQAIPISNKLRLCFIGTLDWRPNIHGLMWFITEVWPEINDLPIELHIAGKNMPTNLKYESKENVFNHGEVEDAIEFINLHDVMIVPLFAGSGQRVKILQGMALGQTVLSTSIGIEGIDAVNDQHYFKCDTKDDFINKITHLCSQRGLLSPETIKENITKKHDLRSLGKQCSTFLEESL